VTPLETAIMATTVFFTSALTTATGVGGGAILFALMLQFMPPLVAIPVHGAVQAFANGWRIWLLREHSVWPVVVRFGLPMPFGVAIGLWLFQELPTATVQILIGCFILMSVFSHSLKFLRHRDLPLWAFSPLGFVVGALNVVVGVVVPLLSAFLIRGDMTRQNIVVTISLFSFIGHVLKVIGFSLIGFSFAEYWVAVVAMIPSIVIGTLLGRHLLGRVSETFFRQLLRVVLALLALKLIVWDSILKGSL